MMKFVLAASSSRETSTKTEVDWKLLANKLQLIISGANNFGDGISPLFTFFSSHFTAFKFT